jgi:hypothetical protein
MVSEAYNYFPSFFPVSFDVSLARLSFHPPHVTLVLSRPQHRKKDSKISGKFVGHQTMALNPKEHCSSLASGGRVRKHAVVEVSP